MHIGMKLNRIHNLYKVNKSLIISYGFQKNLPESDRITNVPSRCKILLRNSSPQMCSHAL